MLMASQIFNSTHWSGMVGRQRKVGVGEEHKNHARECRKWAHIGEEGAHKPPQSMLGPAQATSAALDRALARAGHPWQPGAAHADPAANGLRAATSVEPPSRDGAVLSRMPSHTPPTRRGRSGSA